MAIHRFKINNYSIKLADKLGAYYSVTIKARGVISCRGSANRSIVAYFLADDSPVPAPTTTLGGKCDVVFLPKELMEQWTDMLRNEKPLYGYINTTHPEWTNVSTSKEPVGEEET